MNPRLRVFLLDDHDIVRRGVRALLESDGDVEIVGEASAVLGTAELIAELAPDVAVLDARLPDGSGIELCAQLRDVAPAVRCLILTSYDDEEAIVAAIRAGAAGYVLKEVEGDSLLSAVRTVASGQSLIDPEMARRVIQWIEHTSTAPVELAGLTDPRSDLRGPDQPRDRTAPLPRREDGQEPCHPDPRHPRRPAPHPGRAARFAPAPALTTPVGS
jgi:two-component system response regulator DevR